MKKFASTILYTITALVIADLLILFTAIAQLGVEGRTGAWNEFWLWQARVFVSLIS